MTTTLFFRCAAWLLVLAIAAFTISPLGLRPITGTPANLERFAAFAIIGACFGLAYPRHRIPILLLIIGAVGLLELVQHFIPGRHGRLPDSLVKAAGALAGVAAVMIGARQKGVS